MKIPYDKYWGQSIRVVHTRAIHAVRNSHYDHKNNFALVSNVTYKPDPGGIRQMDADAPTWLIARRNQSVCPSCRHSYFASISIISLLLAINLVIASEDSGACCSFARSYSCSQIISTFFPS